MSTVDHPGPPDGASDTCLSSVPLLYSCVRCRPRSTSRAIRYTTSAYIHIPSVTPLRHTSQSPSMLAACIAQISTTYITSTTLPHYPTPAPYHATPYTTSHPTITPPSATPLSDATRFLLCTYYSPDLLFLFLSFFLFSLCSVSYFFFSVYARSVPSSTHIHIHRLAFSYRFRAAAHALCARACLLLTATPIHLSSTGRAATGASCNTVLILISNRFSSRLFLCFYLYICLGFLYICLCLCVCLSICQLFVFCAIYYIGSPI